MSTPLVEHLFHRLWTKAVGTPDYNKTQWLILQRCLEQRGAFSGVYSAEIGREDVAPFIPDRVAEALAELEPKR